MIWSFKRNYGSNHIYFLPLHQIDTTYPKMKTFTHSTQRRYVTTLFKKKKKSNNWTTWLFFFSSMWHTGSKITYQIFYAFWDNILAMSNPIILVEVILTLDLGKCKYYFPASSPRLCGSCLIQSSCCGPVFILLITEYETAYTSCSISVQIVSFLFISSYLSLSLPLSKISIWHLENIFFWWLNISHSK